MLLNNTGNTNESREQPAQQPPSLQQNSTSNETQEQQPRAEEPPPRLIPETSKTPSFTNSDKYIPVTARFHEAIKLATSHVNNESTKPLAHAVLNNWGDTLVNKLRYISEELMRIEEDYNNGCATSDELDWYKTTLAELAPYGILSSKDSHDVVELLNNNDCEGRSLLLSVLFCVSQDKETKLEWTLTDTLPIELLTSIRNYFETTNTFENTENTNDSASENTEHTNHKKYKKYIFRTIFFRLQRWSNVVVQAQSRISEAFSDDKSTSYLYSSMNIHSVREFNETEYDKVCMKKVYGIVEAHNLSTANNDSKQQDAKSLTSITTATSPASVAFLENKRETNQLPTHPPDVNSIQRKHNQDIKDEYYKHVNGFYDNYVASKAMWKAVLKGNTVPIGKKMETIEPTIISFLETYTFFKEHEELLETEIHPFKNDDHGVYDEFELGKLSKTA
jgi:hypothetical protein